MLTQFTPAALYWVFHATPGAKFTGTGAERPNRQVETFSFNFRINLSWSTSRHTHTHLRSVGWALVGTVATQQQMTTMTLNCGENPLEQGIVTELEPERVCKRFLKQSGDNLV